MANLRLKLMSQRRLCMNGR